MQAAGNQEVIYLTPQAQQLIKTILDAAASLKPLLPGRELEHGFEFHWGHSSQADPRAPPTFPECTDHPAPSRRHIHLDYRPLDDFLSPENSKSHWLASQDILWTPNIYKTFRLTSWIFTLC